MRPRGHVLTTRGFILALAVLAFICGALAITAYREHRRAACWREVVEAGAAPEGDCDRR